MRRHHRGAGRPSRGGWLTRLGKVESGRKRQLHRRRLPRALRVTLGIAAGALGVVALLFLVRLTFDPTLRSRRARAEVEVIRIEPGRDGGAPQAVVSLESREVRIPLAGSWAQAVVPGSRVEVDYTVFPGGGPIRVDRWRPANRPPSP